MIELLTINDNELTIKDIEYIVLCIPDINIDKVKVELDSLTFSIVIKVGDYYGDLNEQLETLVRDEIKRFVPITWLVKIEKFN